MSVNYISQSLRSGEIFEFFCADGVPEIRLSEPGIVEVKVGAAIGVEAEEELVRVTGLTVGMATVFLTIGELAGWMPFIVSDE